MKQTPDLGCDIAAERPAGILVEVAAVGKGQVEVERVVRVGRSGNRFRPAGSHGHDRFGPGLVEPHGLAHTTLGLGVLAVVAKEKVAVA